MAVDGLFQVGQKALIFNDENKILLLKLNNKRFSDLDPNNEFWDFPGGRVQHDEFSQSALLRELDEEISVTPVSTKLIYCCIAKGTKYINNTPVRLFINFYLCKINNYLIKIDNETESFHWVSPNDVSCLVKSKYEIQSIQELMQLYS